MIELYLFSFIPVIGLGIAMMLGIFKKPEYGNRWKYLAIGIGFLVLIVSLASVEIFAPVKVHAIRFSILLVILLLYSLSIFYLELSIHSQRIKLNFLTSDVGFTYKKYKSLTVLSLIFIIASIAVGALFPEVNIVLFLTMAAIALVVANIYMITSVYNFRKGVLRKRDYPFVISIIVFCIYAVIIADSYINNKVNNYSPLLILNLLFLARSYEEYVYFRTQHMQYMLANQHKSKKASARLINRIILSNKKEDSDIIVNVIENMLDNMKRELVMESYGITGLMTFRLFNGFFRIDTDAMIHGYCTPLSTMLSIKKVASDTIHKKLLGTNYNLYHILETPIEQLHDFGEKYLKMIIEQKEIIEVSNIPDCYKGLQKMIAFVPIFNEDKIAGFQVVFKNDYDKLYYFEKKLLKTLGFNLNTIFSIVNGKQVQDERNRLMSEMNIAKDIQTSIVPRSMELDGYSIACNMLTASEVGGDAYDFIKKKAGNYFSIGDVSGHGLPSGITALIFLSSLQAALETADELGAVLEVDKAYDIINRVLCTINRDRIGSDKFMTGNVFRENNGTFQYAGAHEIAVQYCSRENRVIQHKGCTERTAFLGLSEYIKSETSRGEFILESGDILVLYTDGVIEAKDENSIQYGIENLEALLFENKDAKPDVILDLLKKEVFAYAKKGDIRKNGGSLSDDISMVIIKKN